MLIATIIEFYTIVVKAQPNLVAKIFKDPITIKIETRYQLNKCKDQSFDSTAP